MNDELPTLVRSVWDETDPGELPDPTPLRSGIGRSRYGAWPLLLAAAATTAAILVGAVGARALFQGESSPPVTGTPTRVIGLDGVQFEVPRDWPHVQPGCSRPTTPYVTFIAAEAFSCPVMPSGRPTVAASTPPASVSLGSTTDFPDLVFGGGSNSTIAGLQVKISDRTCKQGTCHQSFIARGVFIGLDAPEDQFDDLVALVEHSIAPIPDGYAAVPYAGGLMMPRAARTLFAEQGLILEFPGGVPDYSGIGNQPDAGRIVPVGTVIVAEHMSVSARMGPP